MKKFINTGLKVIGFFIIWSLLVGLIPTRPSNVAAVWRFGAELKPLLLIIALTVVFWFIDKKIIHISVFKKPLFNIGVGIGTGFFWLGTASAILLMTGAMKFTGTNRVPLLWLWILSAFLNVMMQEFLVRGYLYQLIKAKYNLFAATIVTTMLFTFLHGGAFEAGFVPVMNVLTMSLFMTAVLEYTESLLAPIIIHSVWNITGAIFLGGVSLASDYPHFINAVFSDNKLLSGGAYKIEGSVIVLFLNIILLIFFARLNTSLKKKKS